MPHNIILNQPAHERQASSLCLLKVCHVSTGDWTDLMPVVLTASRVISCLMDKHVNSRHKHRLLCFGRYTVSSLATKMAVWALAVCNVADAYSLAKVIRADSKKLMYVQLKRNRQNACMWTWKAVGTAAFCHVHINFAMFGWLGFAVIDDISWHIIITTSMRR